MKDTKSVFIFGFLSSVRRRERSLFRACSRLFGSRGRGERNGSGATQLLISSSTISLSMNCRNVRSSIESPTLLSSLVLSKMVLPRLQSSRTEDFVRRSCVLLFVSKPFFDLELVGARSEDRRSTISQDASAVRSHSCRLVG